MSRFYLLELFAPQSQTISAGVSFGNKPFINAPSGTQAVFYNPTPTQVFTSHPNGEYDPGALNVIFDMLTTVLALGGTSISTVTVEGIGYDDIKQHNNYAGYAAKLYSGMVGGLPLSQNQPVPGLIMQGFVIEGIGNWVGTEMSLTFVVSPDIYSAGYPGNLVLTWEKGQTLTQALQNMLAISYPTMPLDGHISANLTVTHTVVHMAATMHDMANWLLQYTKGALGSDYPGVSITMEGGIIQANDGSNPNPKIIQLLYTDLIGQPVWSDAEQLDVLVALRADVSIYNQIKMPKIEADMPGLLVELPSLNNSQQNYDVSFSGVFNVMATRQIGDFRSADGAGWATLIRCIPTVQEATSAT